VSYDVPFSANHFTFDAKTFLLEDVQKGRWLSSSKAPNTERLHFQYGRIALEDNPLRQVLDSGAAAFILHRLK
jgi:hypothetical protein